MQNVSNATFMRLVPVQCKRFVKKVPRSVLICRSKKSWLVCLGLTFVAPMCTYICACMPVMSFIKRMVYLYNLHNVQYVRGKKKRLMRKRGMSKPNPQTEKFCNVQSRGLMVHVLAVPEYYDLIFVSLRSRYVHCLKTVRRFRTVGYTP